MGVLDSSFTGATGTATCIALQLAERTAIMSPVMTDLPPWGLLTFINYGTNGEKSKSSGEKA
jgi:hypothetical protein